MYAIAYIPYMDPMRMEDDGSVVNVAAKLFLVAEMLRRTPGLAAVFSASWDDRHGCDLIVYIYMRIYNLYISYYIISHSMIPDIQVHNTA